MHYLIPIEKIRSLDLQNGEGFSVIMLHCAFIEFIAAFYYGKIHTHNNPNLASEYYNSCELFVKSLPTIESFNIAFAIKGKDFYANV